LCSQSCSPNLGPHDFRDNYQFGKQACEPISKEAIYPQVTKPLTLIHFDLVLRFTLLLWVAIYFVTFIDDYSKFNWIYFMWNKFEISQYFNISRVVLNRLSTSRFKSFGVIEVGVFFWLSLKCWIQLIIPTMSSHNCIHPVKMGLMNAKIEHLLRRHKLWCLKFKHHDSYIWLGAFMVGVPQHEPWHPFVLCHKS
jgi:hypothetical protein